MSTNVPVHEADDRRESDVMYFVMWGIVISQVWILSPYVHVILFQFQ